MMTFEEFTQLAQSYNVIPVSKTMLADMLTPVSAYAQLRKKSSSSFLFESVEGGERIGRFSFIGTDPELSVRCKGATTSIIDQHSATSSEESFFEIVQRILRRYKQAPMEHLPRFTGGLVGFVGYDAVRFVERIPSTAGPTTGLYDSILTLFKSILVFDHFKHHITIITNVVLTQEVSLVQQYGHAMEELYAIESLLNNHDGRSTRFACELEHLRAETTHEQFVGMVRRAKEHVQQGDIFQVVLSQRFSIEYSGDPFCVYRALRVINPSPYLYYLEFEDCRVIGSSPEILVRVEGAVAEVYPIAGTRPRGTTDDADRQLEKDLLEDEKELSEHIMLVDLGRNDLGRVCEAGSIRVDQLMNIVRYSHVMHIASRITGVVRNDKTCIDVFTATFPAGTVSGAPKIRAMEIIDELEQSRRGIYAGGVGYFDFSGNMDMCIAIRTMFADAKNIYLQAGAGIVADSDPEREFQETINKSRAMIEALRMAQTLHEQVRRPS